MKISGGEPVLFCEGFTTKTSRTSTLQLEIQDHSLQQAIAEFNQSHPAIKPL